MTVRVEAGVRRRGAEGFVTSFTSPTDFVVGSQHVVTTGSTRFEGGVAGDIAVGVRLEVEGVLADDTLTASKVEFRDSIKIEADVANIDIGAGSLTLNGLPDITVTVNGLTEFEDVSGLGGLVAGDHLRIRGRLGSGTTVIASEIAKRPVRTRVELQGPIQSIDATIPDQQIVTILGIAVNTAAIVFGVDDRVITRDEFFTKALVGTLIKALGNRNGSTVVWSRMELEN